MRDVLDIRVRHQCTFYDAVSPALAVQLGARLYSADRKAHGAMPDAVILG